MASDRAFTVYSWLAAAAMNSNESITNAVLCRTACRHLEVDGASVTLMASGEVRGSTRVAQIRQEPVAVAGPASARLEELHLTVGEGPSTDAFTHAAPVLIPDLQAATNRWPGFATAALADKVAAVFAFPLQLGAGQAGVLTAHRTSPGALAPQALSDASVFAELAVHLLCTDPTEPLTAVSRPRSGATADRDQVHQAVGMLAVQQSIGMQEALDRLRAHAFASDTPLADMAHEVITHQLRLPSEGREAE